MLMLGLLLSWAEATEAVRVADNEAVEHRLVAVADQLECLVCQDESLAASRTELAQALRGEIRSFIQAGKTDAEILEYLLDRYGEFIRYQSPSVEPGTWLLWSAPMLLLVIGLGAMTWHVRRRRHHVARQEAGCVHAPKV